MPRAMSAARRAAKDLVIKMKTAETIEAQEERKKTGSWHFKDERKMPGVGSGNNPNSHTKIGKRYDGNHVKTNLPKMNPWVKGQSGNPAGRAKNDLAREIAKAVFENNAEALYEVFTAALFKGNAYCFKELADRAYGKLKESVDLQVSPYRNETDESINARIKQLESQLGYGSAPGDSPANSGTESRTIPASFPKTH